MPDTDITPINPSYLDGTGFFPDEDDKDEEVSLSLPYINFPQKLSENGTAGKIEISSAMAIQPEELAHLDVILIAALTVKRGKWEVYGNRSVWNPDLNVHEVMCSSPNGIAPREEFLGKEVPYATQQKDSGQTFKIGFTKQGEVIEDGKVCLQCPLADWDVAKSLGFSSPICKPLHSFIVWSPEFGMLSLRAKNTSMQVALNGAKRNKFGAKSDNSPLVGIEHFFNPIGSTTKIIEKDKMHISLARMVDYYILADGGALPVDQEHTPQQIVDFIASEEGEKIEKVVIKLKTYHFAPEGLPTALNASPPMMKVRMTPVQNNAKPSSAWVPEFTLTEEKWSGEDINNYLENVRVFTEQNMRDRYMRLDLVEDAVEWAKNLSNDSEPALPEAVEETSADPLV